MFTSAYFIDPWEQTDRQRREEILWDYIKQRKLILKIIWYSLI